MAPKKYLDVEDHEVYKTLCQLHIEDCVLTGFCQEKKSSDNLKVQISVLKHMIYSAFSLTPET